jgi:phosphoribosylanthranilate isomerase
MYVKICGLTSVEDARAALEAGADLLGFTFYPPSPRYITPERCAEIVRALLGDATAAPDRREGAHKGRPYGDPRLVGLFVNTPADDVAAVLDRCGLDLAQLHGDESPDVLHALGGRAFKAFRGNGSEHARYTAAGPGQPAFLVDAAVAGKFGGTGQTADWDGAAQLAAAYPLLLAGGLTADNVAAAVARVQPWGVDVASGVEATPGRKDHAKVKAFVANAKKFIADR